MKLENVVEMPVMKRVELVRESESAVVLRDWEIEKLKNQFWDNYDNLDYINGMNHALILLGYQFYVITEDE